MFVFGGVFQSGSVQTAFADGKYIVVISLSGQIITDKNFGNRVV